MSKFPILVAAFSFAFFFQNCSQMQFSKVPAQSSGPIDNELIVDDPGGDSGSDPEDQSPEKDSNPPKSCHNKHPPSHHKDGRGGCNDIVIAKVLINVNHLEFKPSGAVLDVPDNTVVDLLTLDSVGFKFGPIAGTNLIETREIRFVLNDFGNKIISAAMIEVPLKTPSAQNSGLKFKLDGVEALEPGRSYIIKAEFDPDSRIVTAGDKCILKPVLKRVSVEEAP